MTGRIVWRGCRSGELTGLTAGTGGDWHIPAPVQETFSAQDPQQFDKGLPVPKRYNPSTFCVTF